MLIRVFLGMFYLYGIVIRGWFSKVATLTMVYYGRVNHGEFTGPSQPTVACVYLLYSGRAVNGVRRTYFICVCLKDWYCLRYAISEVCGSPRYIRLLCYCVSSVGTCFDKVFREVYT